MFWLMPNERKNNLRSRFREVRAAAEPEKVINISRDFIHNVSMRKYFFVTVSALLVTLVLILLVDRFSHSESSEEIIKNAVATKRYFIAEKEYKRLLADDFGNVELHRGYINNYFSILSSKSKYSSRSDKDILKEYQDYLITKPEYRDIILYCIGFYYVKIYDFESALSFYLQINDEKIPYVNNSIGYIYLQTDQADAAKKYFYKEIEIRGNVSGAYSNLSKLLFSTKQYAELDKLLSNKESLKYISSNILIRYTLIQKKYFSYLAERFLDFFRNIIPEGFIAGILISAVWIFFFHKIDVFEKDRISILIFTFLLGIISAFLSSILYDIWHIYFKFHLSGSLVNDLIYSVFCIGFIEELVKLIPFLVVLFALKEMNESVDFIIYASLGALGFATIENMHYFNELGLSNINSRALSAVVLHMALTSLSVYGLFVKKYKGIGLYVIPTFLAAMILHGVYDFFLISNYNVQSFRIVSFVILIFLINVYSKIISNALNLSEYNNHKENLSINLIPILYYGFLSVLMLQTFLTAIKYDMRNALMNLLWEGYTTFFLFYYLVSSFGRFQVKKFQWASLLKRKS